MLNVKISGIALFLLILLSCYPDAESEKSEMEKTDKCFSEMNLSIVHNYLKQQISTGNTPYYKYDGYELYIDEEITIFLKDKGYTLAVINKKNGIVSLAVLQKNNERIVKTATGIFCRILLMAKE
ncbi:MAG: hypothetical protein CVV49_01495 [Spirochaetae bacterium HGW-Spirochaetae-5]|nr:MAG: hypothetical protein CVV49_01495 [Spirochaetae bacterium HGW-Spirochaetae-5]